MELFRFIDWVLALPEELEDQLWVEVRQFEEEKQMHYVSRLERVAQSKLLGLLIRQRFGMLPEVDVRLQEATLEQFRDAGAADIGGGEPGRRIRARW